WACSGRWAMVNPSNSPPCGSVAAVAAVSTSVHTSARAAAARRTVGMVTSGGGRGTFPGRTSHDDPGRRASTRVNLAPVDNPARHAFPARSERVQAGEDRVQYVFSTQAPRGPTSLEGTVD